MHIRHSLLTIAAAVALIAPLHALASKEGVLVLNEMRVASQGIDDSGPIVVTATRNSKGFDSFAVQAFGRTVSLPKTELAKLQGDFVNGVQLSFESGYRELGGRTVYVVLSKGFTSGVEETQCVSINERGDVKVENVVRKLTA